MFLFENVFPLFFLTDFYDFEASSTLYILVFHNL